jgi:regulator of sigma E protease
MPVLDYVVDWILPFLIVLSVLVFVHELGHYVVARLCGVRVEVFSIGFGPELFGINDRAGTRWKFSAVPLGGYVKMFGEFDFSDDPAPEMSAEDRKVSFHHKPLRSRAAVVAAGPLANFAFAVLVLAGLFLLVGVPKPLPVVGVVQENSAAAEAGFRPGDRILSIDGTAIDWFEDLRQTVRSQPGVRLTFEVLRDERVTVLTGAPRPAPDEGAAVDAAMVGLLGIRPDLAQVGYERLGPISAIDAAVERGYALTTQILGALWQIVTGARTAEELGGPLRIAQLSGQMAQDGVLNLIFFMAALSINLGLVNLLPIPMLDGGHLVFYAVEAIRGRPLNKRIQEYGFRFGLIFVLLLMIFATWNDLLSLKVFDLFE